MNILTSPAATVVKDAFKEHNGFLRSNSGKELYKHRTIQRFYSDNHLYYSINRVLVASKQSRLKNSSLVVSFPFKASSSKTPNLYWSFLFHREKKKDMNMMVKELNIVENSEESDEEEKETKRSFWVNRPLIEIRGHWNKRTLKEPEDSDANSDCDGDKGGCVFSYISEEVGDQARYDQESFFKLLVQVPWSDTKIFSQLAFLCNMAYVIPNVKAEDLKRYYDLQFVTSSLEKKAKIAAIKAKLDEDSTCSPVISSAATGFCSQKSMNSEQKHSIRSFLARDISASAASYMLRKWAA